MRLWSFRAFIEPHHCNGCPLPVRKQPSDC